MPRRKKTVTRNADALFNLGFYGIEEPDINKNLGDILNWYNAICDDDQAREWLNEWFTELDRKQDIHLLNQVPGDWTPRTSAWLARLSLRGYPLSDHNIEFMEEQLQKSFGHIPAIPTKTVVTIYKPNVQEYTREKTSNLIGELEGMIDDGVITTEWSLYDFLRSREVSAMIANRVAEHFQPIADELIEATNTTDKDLKEGYKKYRTADIEDKAIIYQTMVDDALSYANNTKKMRAPRRKKAKSIETILKHFKYAKVNEVLKLASIDPAKIIGASELWAFNPKYKKITVYRANDSDGLNIKRSTIININEQTSLMKIVGKKTDERIQEVLTGGKIVLRNFMNNKSHPIKTGRVNKDTILLRIM